MCVTCDGYEVKVMMRVCEGEKGKRKTLMFALV